MNGQDQSPEAQGTTHAVGQSAEQLIQQGFVGAEPLTPSQLDERDRAEEIKAAHNVVAEIEGRSEVTDVTEVDDKTTGDAIELNYYEIARREAQIKGTPPLSREAYEAQINKSQSRHPSG